MLFGTLVFVLYRLAVWFFESNFNVFIVRGSHFQDFSTAFTATTDFLHRSQWNQNHSMFKPI